jgi:hypothetical protein
VTEGVCVSATFVMAVEIAAFITSVGLAIAGIDVKFLQDVTVTVTRKTIVIDLWMNFISLSFFEQSA